MPFGEIKCPSLGVSLLKPGAVQAGFGATIRYFNFDFAEWIGESLYSQISGSFVSGSLVGDWLFAEALFFMPLETSRGCWWGQKFQCKFCAFQEHAIGFRSKSLDRVLEEMEYLARNHGDMRIMFSDDIIDAGCFHTLFPELARIGAPYSIFTELKGNLTFDNLLTLHDAGVRYIQAGLEHLSDMIQRLIPKGCTAFSNIQVLR